MVTVSVTRLAADRPAADAPVSAGSAGSSCTTDRAWISRTSPVSVFSSMRNTSVVVPLIVPTMLLPTLFSTTASPLSVSVRPLATLLPPSFSANAYVIALASATPSWLTSRNPSLPKFAVPNSPAKLVHAVVSGIAVSSVVNVGTVTEFGSIDGPSSTNLKASPILRTAVSVS